MTAYFISIISFCFSSLIRQKKISLILLYLPAFIICFGYMTGSDWRNYELIYDGRKNRVFEPGLDIIFYLGNYLNITFWPLIIGLKLVCYHKVIKIFKKYFNELSGIFLTLFFAEWGFYLFIDNPLRSFIAFYFSLFFIENLLLGNQKKALIFASIAFIFHFSAIFLFVLFGLKKIKIKYAIYMLIFTILSITISTDFYATINSLTNLTANDILFSERISIYLDNEDFISDMRLLGYIHRSIFILILGLGIRAFDGNEQKKIIFNFSMLYLVLYPLTSQIIVLKRLDLFLVFSFCFSFYIIYSHTKFKLLLLSYLLSFSIIKSFLLFTGDYRYVPYSNYLIEIYKGEDKGYYYRSNFNYKNSPYAK